MGMIQRRARQSDVAPKEREVHRRQAVYIHQRSVCLDVDLYYSLTAYAQIIQEEIADGSRVNVSAAMRALLDSGLEDHRAKVVARAKRLERAAKQAAIQYEMDQATLRDQRRAKRLKKATTHARKHTVKLPEPDAVVPNVEQPRQMKLVV